MRRATSLIAILVFTPLASLVARGFPPLRGDRVRIYASQTADGRYGRFAGSVVRSDSDSLVLRTADAVRVAAPWPSIIRLEVSRGRKSHGGRGAAFGALIGIPLGAVVGLAAYEECVPRGGSWDFSCLFDWGSEYSAFGGALVGGLGGVVVGALIGATIETDRWQEVPLDQLRVSFGPQRDGRFGFGASVRF
jgi:hypothetical protein